MCAVNEIIIYSNIKNVSGQYNVVKKNACTCIHKNTITCHRFLDCYLPYKKKILQVIRLNTKNSKYLNKKIKNVIYIIYIYMHQQMFLLISSHPGIAEILLKLVLNINQSFNQYWYLVCSNYKGSDAFNRWKYSCF